jgi:hypothetical protein
VVDKHLRYQRPPAGGRLRGGSVPCSTRGGPASMQRLAGTSKCCVAHVRQRLDAPDGINDPKAVPGLDVQG